MVDDVIGLSRWQRVAKRCFDLAIGSVLFCCTWWLIIIALIAATIDTREFGLFVQSRVGKDGQPFPLIKIRTMRASAFVVTRVTTAKDPRVTRLGWWLRRTKIDELPQIINVLLGHMSLVGPRPDVPGFADHLQGEDRVILSVRPGITGPATLKYRCEEKILAAQPDPEAYNRSIIFPDKVRINLHYVRNYSLFTDMRILWQTVVSRRAGHLRVCKGAELPG